MIRFIIVLTAMTLCVYASTASAQSPPDTLGDTLGIIDTGIVTGNGVDDGIDTGIVGETVDTVDINTATKAVDKDVIDLDDDELLQAALAVDSAQTAPPTQKLDLIRREYEYKRQTRAAIIMMIFIAVAMATSQSWNPR